jgi:hypothetical protein
MIGLLITVALLGFMAIKLNSTGSGGARAGQNATPTDTASPGPIPTTVIIDPGPPGQVAPVDRFDPPGSTDEPGLSAAQALQASGYQLPPDIQPEFHFGLFTSAIGNGDFNYQDRLAWGIDWHSCPPYHVNPIHPDYSPTANPCIEWIFLDANSGAFLMGEWQH